MRRYSDAGAFVTTKRWLWPLIDIGLVILCTIRDIDRWYHNKTGHQ